MDTRQHTAVRLDEACWDMLSDGGLAWICGPTAVSPYPLLDNGALIMRRWRGSKYPRPAFPPAVGFVLRDATQVDVADGVTDDADTIYWYDVDRVSAVGVVARTAGCSSRAVVIDDAGDYVGLVPNPPLAVDVRQGPDGDLHLTWCYNPVDEQDTPAEFAIYTDSGSGTISESPLATVSYAAGRQWYTHTITGGGWDGWQFVVLARLADETRSLTPLLHGRGLSPTYGLTGAAISQELEEVTAAPPAPTEVTL